MMSKILRMLPSSPIVAALLFVTGCSTGDERLVELSRESVARQAEQNRLIARQSTEIAAAAHELVEADAQARNEFIKLCRDLHAERSSIDGQRAELERDRREIAWQRHRDPMIAAAIQ
ncbi:unnamed protein product [marine sediment metagenome]|uniref:Uncharacterized protein n=1 Tax=marine sediment metagenome TaxID=412755 RepID=X0XDE4_9ZZZZ